MLHRATMLHDLIAPPGNRLEALKGDRKGQHSIRVNEQYRVCFIWHAGDAFEVVVAVVVELVDGVDVDGY